MAERYPTDEVLLALSEDIDTEVPYMVTGQTPYFLAFRQMQQRLLLAFKRANDFRVYQDGDLSIGLRAGRYVINNTVQNYAGSTLIAISPNTSNYFWLDVAGALQMGSSLPTDRSAYLSLAQVVADTTSITSLTDLRSESLFFVPSLPSLGVTATANRINEALAGSNATVDASALNTLTAGPSSTADSEHRHLDIVQDTDATTYFRLTNNNAGSNTNMGLAFSLPQVLLDDTTFTVNKNNGYFEQTYFGKTFNLVGSVHALYKYAGALTASLTGDLVGVVPVDGQVSDVILSVGNNMQSSLGTDGISVTVSVNSTALTTTHPSLTSAAGTGFRCTDQSDGTASVIKTDGTEDVTKGDLLSIDITRTAAGTITTQVSDVVVLIVIKVNAPE